MRIDAPCGDLAESTPDVRRRRWQQARKRRTSWNVLLLLGATGGFALSAAVVLLSTFASYHNYPGGDAMAFIHSREASLGSQGDSRCSPAWRDAQAATTHVTATVALPYYVLQSGASRFTFEHDTPLRLSTPNTTWTYLRSAALLERDTAVVARDLAARGVDAALTNAPAVYAAEGWRPCAEFVSFAGVRRKGLVPLGLRWSEQFTMMVREGQAEGCKIEAVAAQGQA